MIRFKLDKDTTDSIDKITSIYNFSKETVTLRICFAFSLQLNKRFELKNLATPPSNGKEFLPTSNVFGRIINDRDNYIIYNSTLSAHYGMEINLELSAKLFKLHCEDGASKILQRLSNVDFTSGEHFAFLMKLVKNGLDLQSDIIQISNVFKQKTEISEYTEPLSFIIGKTENNESIEIKINDLREFDNRNIAIAGMAGSGKTELIKDILFQISKNTTNQLKFIFFDYKGEGNATRLKSFFDKTNCQFIDILNDGFNFNPLTSINISEGERQRTFSIKAFVDTIATFVPNIGVSQKNILQTVITDLLESKEKSYPNMSELFQEIEEYYAATKTKPDTLYSAIRDLASGLFSDDISENVVDKSIYLNLPPTLSDTLRQLCVFLLLRYFNFYFSSANDAVPNENIIPLRYVIVIDEAHIYLKNKNARKALEDLLRLLRSKGVIVVMLSQGVEDYKTKDFDFVSQVKLPICLNVQNKDPKLIKAFVGTPRSEHKLINEINKLDSGFGLINLDEPKTIEIRQLWKTMENE